jgi:hypothetical protein
MDDVDLVYFNQKKSKFNYHAMWQKSIGPHGSI